MAMHLRMSRRPLYMRLPHENIMVLKRFLKKYCFNLVKHHKGYYCALLIALLSSASENRSERHELFNKNLLANTEG